MAVGEQRSGVGSDDLLTYAPLEDGAGLEIFDHIERRHVTIETAEPVSPTESSTDLFEFPVRRAFSVEVDRLFLPQQLAMIVRNSLGFMVAEVSKGDSRAFPPDVYTLDPGAHIKLYLTFDAGFEVDVSSDGIRLAFDSTSRVHVGMRSHHKQPAATVTTTDDVGDLMTAVSYFSSALKTTSCERAYPTLRGHPPLVERGDELSVPSVLSRPDTGIRIEVPEDRRSVYTSAPLAYYLGADLVPGETPRLVSEDGFERRLSGPDLELQDGVERTLKQVFFLDCLTRTEGFFQVNLHERNAIEPAVDLDFEALYDQPIAHQLEAYLEVPYDVLEPEFPTWKLTAHVASGPETAEALPFLVNDLAAIKVIDDHPTGQPAVGTARVSDFTRNSGAATRSTADAAPSPSTVRIEDDESMEQLWLGDGAPLGASKGMLEAFRNRLGRSPSDSDIDITVVCNSADMGQERDVVDEVYGSRDELPFDVSVHRELTTGEMAGVLREDIDFLHYIGHIDAGGFECADGRLDVGEIERTGVDTFLLNACSSYEQGMELIRAGSIAGVVTLQDVINSGAERVGMTLARLLNWGFPLRPAMNIARRESIMGGHYLVIGDGSIDIAQPEKGVEELFDISKIGSKWRVKLISYPNQDKDLGSIIRPHFDSCEEYFLISGCKPEFLLTSYELQKLLSFENVPIRTDGKLTWRDEFIEMIS